MCPLKYLPAAPCRGVVTFALLISGAIAWCVGMEMRPIYSLLLVVVVMSFSFTLLSWRLFKEREWAMAQLRPFIASQHIYEKVLSAPHKDGRAEAQVTFNVLCENILETCGARLVPLGALAPLAGAPLLFPDEAHAPAADIVVPADIKVLCSPLETEQGTIWRIPLREETHLNGMLLLAEKVDGGLYTEEEMEVARAGGERLLDALAAAALASRLMELQRRRLAETQVADQAARRALHDEVLPRLHTAMLMLSGDATDRTEAQQLLTGVHKEISALLRAMPSALTPPIAKLGLWGALQKTMEDEFVNSFDKVRWNITPQAEKCAQEFSSLTAEVLFHAAREAIRNAAKYSRDGDKSTFVQIEISAQVESEFQLRIADNGVGLNSTKNKSNSGHGLALHGTMMAVIGGKLAVENNAPQGVRVELTVPVNG